MAKARILVVDDEPRMRELIRLYLQTEFTVLEAEDGRDALRLIDSESPNLVLLDVMMPHLDGWATLERIREESPLPVIMLTARGDVPDRVQGLRMGADDYIAKPFDGRELVARIQAVLRRTSSPSEGQKAIRRGDLAISPEQRTATWKGRELSLTPKEFDLLTLLAAHPGQAFPRERLLDRVWGADFEGDIRTVDSHIKNLREELGDGAGMIATVWGIGYRFVEDPHAKR
ncbi:MAG TPA: response regulator transcription factor [Symbiobacteriaceae bacterium]|nr:response regulator transcription factor [Symbiobacteriaceae bacterium]